MRKNDRNMCWKIMFAGMSTMLIFAGCGDKKEDMTGQFEIVGESIDPSTEAVPEEERTDLDEAEVMFPADEDAPDVGQEKKQDDTIKNLGNYSVTIPKSWLEKSLIEEFADTSANGEAWGYTFFCKEAADADMGGFLFALGNYTDPRDFIQLPSYQYLGTLQQEDQVLYIVAEYPTDVQFDEASSASYMEMQQQIDGILQSIHPKAGVNFSEERPKKLDAAIRRMEYVNAVALLHFDGTMPDGSDAEDWDGDMSNDQYAIFDIDGDEKEELIITIGDSYVAGMKEVIYEFDVTSGKMKKEVLLFPSATYFENGTIQAFASHNQGLGGDFWPFEIYQYNSKTDTYDYIAYVDAWEKETFPESYDGKAFPEDIDADGNGYVYQIYDSDYNGEGSWMDDPVFHTWLEQWIGSAKEIDFKRIDMTKENINQLLSEY